MTVLVCHRGIGPKVRAHALVAGDDFLGPLRFGPGAGRRLETSHKLFGESYVDRILVLNTAKGGVASAWMLREMVVRGVAPTALVFNTVNPILAQGAAFAGLALIDRFEDGDITTLVRTGDLVEVVPGEGRLTILA